MEWIERKLSRIFSPTGIDLFLDLEVIDKAAVERTQRILQDALKALEAKSKAK